MTVSEPATDVSDAALYSAGVTAVVIRSMVGLSLIPPPSVIEILVAVPVIVLVLIEPELVLAIKPVVVRLAIALRSLSYG